MANLVMSFLKRFPLLVLLCCVPGRAQTWQEYSLPPGSHPIGVTAGPDGAVWVTETGTDKLLRIGMDGTQTEFPVPGGAFPVGIVTGPDGGLWFTEYGRNRVGRFTPTGSLSEFPLPKYPDAAYNFDPQPGNLCVGPDGAIWYASTRYAAVGRISLDGTVTQTLIGLHPEMGETTNLAAGPDGALWVALGDAGAARMTMSGDVSFAPFTVDYFKLVAPGADGSLWFLGRQHLHFLTADQSRHLLPSYVNLGDQTFQMCLGPDGSLWFPDANGRLLGVASYAPYVESSTAAFAFDSPGATPLSAVAVGPDGALWLTAFGSDKVYRFTGYNYPTRLVPVVLDVQGAGGSHYTTEITLAHRSTTRGTRIGLRFAPSNGVGHGVAAVTLGTSAFSSNNPNAQLPSQIVIPDAIAFLRSQGVYIPPGAVGTLQATFQGVRPDEIYVGARTTTPGQGGSFGLSYAPLPSTGGTVHVVGLQENASQRSNLALINAGGTAIRLHVELRDAGGKSLDAGRDVDLGPFGWTQLNRVLSGLAATGRAIVTRAQGTSAFSAYGVLNDNGTSDGSFIPQVDPASTQGADRLVPVVLDVAGLAASRYRTELTFTNLSGAPITLTALYTGALGTGSGTLSVPLAAGAQTVLPDAIAALRNAGVLISGGNVAGALLVTSSSSHAADFAVLARTFTASSDGNGTFGVAYPGFASNELASSTAYIHGLQQNLRTRANVAVVNRGDAADSITLRLTFLDDHGFAVGAPQDLVLAPGEWRQLNQPLSDLNVSLGSVKVERVAGKSLFLAYGVLNDAVTSDGSFVGMVSVP